MVFIVILVYIILLKKLRFDQTVVLEEDIGDDSSGAQVVRDRKNVGNRWFRTFKVSKAFSAIKSYSMIPFIYFHKFVLLVFHQAKRIFIFI